MYLIANGLISVYFGQSTYTCCLELRRLSDLCGSLFSDNIAASIYRVSNGKPVSL